MSPLFGPGAGERRWGPKRRAKRHAAASAKREGERASAPREPDRRLRLASARPRCL
jgi:hypothetical protein